MLNECRFIGRTGKDVELRYTPSGDAVASVSLATSKSWKDKNGQKQERTEWINLVAWKNLAEIFGEHVTKGKLIYVMGEQRTRSYDDRDGNKRYITEVHVTEMLMLDSRNEDNQGSSSRRQARPTQERQPAQARQEAPPDPNDDDIPF